ncbi:MAG: Lrp/AsnC family transcriptional regulator [Candidatus Jordarchaeum sp.]|uniref:Lrp/AsnC family transcriptional regulator n=1 Tax=Candidatus Jordarchaeum sp. TaxID=2823881 RepID=UPI004049B1B0
MIDNIDKKILKELLANARQSHREIAKKIEVSVGTVVTRTKKMEEEGLIKGYTAILDHERLGYELTVVTEITVSQGRLLEVDKEISKNPHTCAVYDVTGTVDAIIVAKFRNRNELSNFTKGLLSIPYVERANTHVVLNTIKENFEIL